VIKLLEQETSLPGCQRESNRKVSNSEIPQCKARVKDIKLNQIKGSETFSKIKITKWFQSIAQFYTHPGITITKQSLVHRHSIIKVYLHWTIENEINKTPQSIIINSTLTPAQNVLNQDSLPIPLTLTQTAKWK